MPDDEATAFPVPKGPLEGLKEFLLERLQSYWPRATLGDAGLGRAIITFKTAELDCQGFEMEGCEIPEFGKVAELLSHVKAGYGGWDTQQVNQMIKSAMAGKDIFVPERTPDYEDA